MRSSTAPISVRPELCIHHRSPLGACSKCIEVCPRAALKLGRMALLFDEAACDDCGLCAAACPEGAMEIAPGLPVIADDDGGLVAFAACEQVDIADRGDVMACVNSIGLRTLFDLYGRGVRRIACATGACATCERSTSKPLGQIVEQANKVLSSRHSEPFVFEEETPASWQWRLNAADRIGPSDRGRRQLFRGMMEKLSDAGTTTGPKAAGSAFPGLPPVPRDSKALHFYVPEISRATCRGCDACVQLCRHEAILLWRSAEGLAYVIDPERCSGCGLCVDICDAHALVVTPLETPKRLGVPLQLSKCQACGVRFHMPRRGGQDYALCSICAEGGQHRKLFQINA